MQSGQHKMLIRENAETREVELYAMRVVARHFGAERLQRYDPGNPIADLDGVMTMADGTKLALEVKSSVTRGEAALNNRKLEKMRRALEQHSGVLFVVCGKVDGPVWCLNMADWPPSSATKAVLHDPRQQTKLDTERGWRVPLVDMHMIRRDTHATQDAGHLCRGSEGTLS